MPMPWTYRHGEVEWRGFLDDIAEILDTPSSNVAYTTAEGVLHSFRGRLTPDQTLGFSDALPAMIRALFIQGFRLAPAAPWADHDTYLAETLALRQDHNFAGDRAIEAVSYALHRAMGRANLEHALDSISPKARAFWHISGYAEPDLEFRFR